MRKIWLGLLLSLLAVPAHAQSTVRLCVMTSSTHCEPVTSGAPLPVNASVSVGGFAPSLAYATCTSTGSACASTALPTNTGSVILFNSGSTTVSCTLASGAATALASELQIPASSGLPLATVYGATTYDHFSCIDQTGSASNVVIASGGTGLPTGWGGGGGGGGAVTIADGADVTQGAIADTAWSGSGSGTSIAILKAIYGAAIGPVPGLSGSAQSSSNPMGYVNINQTTPGTTNGVDPTTPASWGIGAPAATAPAKGVFQVGRAASTQPTEVTDGQAVGVQTSLGGKPIVLPYTVKELAALGTGSGTTTGAITVIAASGSASLKTYVTSVQCGRDDAGTTAIHVTFNDSKSSPLVLPNNGGGGGNNVVFPVPLVTAANTAFTATPSGATTTVYCNAQGFYGP